MQTRDENVSFFFFRLFQHCNGVIGQAQKQTLGSIKKGNMKEAEKPRAGDKFCCVSKLKVQKYFGNFL